LFSTFLFRRIPVLKCHPMKCNQKHKLMRISFIFLIVLLFVRGYPAEENTEEETVIEDFFICRTCGNDVSVANLAFDKYTPLALSATNHSFTETRSVLIQEVQNPLGIRFHIFLVKQASCAKVHPWTIKSTWFPGYAWKVCVCPKCHTLLGWMFEPVESATAEQSFPSEAGFYAIIFQNIITEGFVNSLLMKEKALRDN
uniref:CULT domain-containing protein n=1 Tax=Anopheles coluzzii TaxID=1518534 RepID=A0A8W7PKI3_ANOCL